MKSSLPKKIVYSEPVDYFPKELRIKYKVGEYAPKDTDKDEQKENNSDNK